MDLNIEKGGIRKMGILDMTDNFSNQIKPNEFKAQNIDSYTNGVKEHTQPIVTFTEEGKNVIYREQL